MFGQSRAETLAALQQLGPRDVPPILVEVDATLADLAAAVLAQDQAGVDAAAVRRGLTVTPGLPDVPAELIS